jgi:ParB/RepB/Spo0J family partition protein
MAAKKKGPSKKKSPSKKSGAKKSPPPKKTPTKGSPTAVAGVKGSGKKEGMSTRLPTSKVLIMKGHNPRQVTGDLDALAASVKANGIQQSLAVRPSKTKAGYYDLLAGERRLRVAKALNLATVPVIIREDMDDDVRAQTFAVAENSDDSRFNLNAIEIGRVAERAAKSGYSVERIARDMGIHPRRARRYLNLMKAPDNIQKDVMSGELSVHAGLALAKLDAKMREKIKKSLHSGSTPITAKAINDLAKEQTEKAGVVPDVSGSTRLKGAVRDASIIVRRGMREQNAALAEAAYYYVNADKDSVGTTDYHELRGALGFALWARGDLASWILPDIDPKLEENSKTAAAINAKFESRVKAAAAKFEPEE